jgi:hypothetical protein
MARHDDMPRHDDPTELEPRPRTPPLTGTGSTTPQLKMDIDSGATGDKLAVLDVGMVPLGTDDEAAGFPPTPDWSTRCGRRSAWRHLLQATRASGRCREGAGDPHPHPDGGRARARGGTDRLNAPEMSSPERQVAC